MRETAVTFGPTRSLVGVVTEPAPHRARPDLPAFLILNSGLVHRIGPKRMSVTLARRLAARGFVSIRFDFSGIGDSRVATSHGALRDRWIAEATDAMGFLRASRGIERFVPLGNCSGANMSYLLALAQPQVVGAALINPQGLHAIRYYVRLLFTNSKVWRRMLTGARWLKRNRAMRRPMMPRDRDSGRTPISRQAVLDGVSSLVQRGVRLLIVNCEWDQGYDYFHHVIRHRLDAIGHDGRLRLEIVPRVDHDFNLLAGQRRLLDIIEHWSESLSRSGADSRG